MPWIKPKNIFSWGRAACIAIRFLTRLPAPEIASPTAREEGRSLACYPLVGLLLGLLLLFLGATLHSFLPGQVAAAVLLVLWLLLTGFLHLDGLADSFDALMGGASPAERTEILKDPRCGTAGVTALILVLLVKFATLGTLLAEGGLWALLWTAFAGRAALALLVLHSDYVHAKGLGANLAQNASPQSVWLCCAVPALLMLLFAPLAALLALGAAAGVLFLLRLYWQKQFGGVSGDTLGASLEIVEAVTLCVLAFLVTA